MRSRVLSYVFAAVLCSSLCHTRLLGASGPTFSDSFGQVEERAMVDLIREVDKKASDTFKKGKGPSKAIFLSRFWDDHCPTFSKLYVDVQLGHRYMNTSPNFYNDPEFLAPDYWVHVTPLDVNDLNRAVTLLNTLLQANLDDGVARIGLGYALLELGEYQKADDSFMLALKTLRKEPCIYNGRGLAWVKREKGSQMARDHFRDALALDRNYEAASYNLAMSQVSLRATDVPFHIRKVTRAFPDHQDAYYKLGVWHEIGSRFDNEFLSEAMDAYQAQTGANAGHYAAWSNLARIKMKMGHPGDAIGICKRVLEEAPVYRIRVLPTLMEAYQAVRQIAEADKAATRYVAMLDPKTREHFLDISLITSRKEKALLDGLSGKAIDEFRHDFWMRHDPTPGTPENEKRVEHVRRVGIAMVLYSEATKPWDTRGDVYIRYGEPRHKSRSDNMRFETDPSVVRVRDRLLGALSDVERNEIRQSHRRIRTSTRDVEKVTNESGSFSIVVNDFEPAEFGYDPGAGDNRMGAPDPNEKEYQTGLIESINDRIPPQEIRGLPLFPVEGNRPWEYWVYPDVGDGIEVVFTAFNQHGGYGFAEPLPTGRKVSRFNRQTFVRLRPENVVIKAITRQPSLLRMHHIPLEFAYDAADFRGSRDQTRMELYVGRIGGLVGDTVRTDASMILYDKSWNPVFESSGEFSHVMGRDADSLQTIEIDGEVPPGEYILAVQIDDPTTGAMGSQRLGVEIEAFVDSVLSISDIAFASSMVEDSTTRRGGFRMTPHPWRKYAPTDPVVVYYEIYGLADDSFGQTQYQMDYQITPLDGGTLSAKVLRGIGRQLGVEQRESLTISYARTGEDADEFSYVEIDVAGSAPGSYELTVTITDSVTGQRASKRRAFTIDRVD